MSATRRNFLSFLAAGAVAFGAVSIGTISLGAWADAAAAEKPATIGIDYAYYNPVSLLMKNKSWIEEEFAAEGVKVNWVLSLGSNKALEFLRGGSLDFGSTAGSAALVGKAGGLPIKSIYAYSRPEWTALVTRKDSGITRIEDLKGKSVAVTRGTDPHIFLLRALDSKGLGERDIKPVLLQHPDGYTALVKGQVDAWAGLDPHMARAELESGAVLFFRNADLNTYGILNVREAFADRYPDVVRRVLAVYERARHYSIQNPDELRKTLVAAARIPEEVARKQLAERTDLSDPVIGPAHRQTFLATGAVLQKIGVIKPDVDVAATVDALIDSSFLTRAASR